MELGDWYKQLNIAQQNCIGYPCNMALQDNVNNVGSPYGESIYQVNTKLWGFDKRNIWDI